MVKGTDGKQKVSTYGIAKDVYACVRLCFLPRCVSYLTSTLFVYIPSR